MLNLFLFINFLLYSLNWSWQLTYMYPVDEEYKHPYQIDSQIQLLFFLEVNIYLFFVLIFLLINELITYVVEQ